MALPTTNLTFHVDASVNTDLWQAVNPFATHPTDGQVVNHWDDVEHADIQAAIISTAPVWRSSTPLMLNPCIDFDGTATALRLMPNDNSVGKALSTVISNLTFTVFVAIYAEGISSNAAATYDNDGILTDGGGYWAIALKDSSAPKVLFYNYDGNEDNISIATTLNASHILMYRHATTSIFASVDNGTESTALSGTTDATGMATIVRFGVNYAGTKFYNGRIGEIAIYSTALTGTPFTDAMSYFMVKWVTGAVAASEVELNRTAVCTPVRIG